MNLTGKLLVATPLIAAPPFGRSVVIVLAHGEGGAFGLVLNQPTQFQAGDVISEWSDHLAPPAVVFEGGPVERESIVALGYSLDLDEENPSVLAGCVAPVNLGNISQQARELWTGIRIFAGSAGWAPGQLEDEIVENA
ncbi:MAG: YqgE/AlgH family protein, partial [Acidimicrobiales bacterium]|nr:YqgE/AlgH family protein [Acidimicrobiales bacterium]